MLKKPHPQRLPHFLVLGAQKGGTTSLQKLLEQHPKVYLPPCKEVQYFSLNSEKPLSWYSDHYKEAKQGQIRGEITPYYLFHPDVPKRIKKAIPRVGMIALLRDPVERTLSQIFHARRHGFEHLDIEKALDAEELRISSGSLYSLQKHSYLARSRYLEQLDRYESLFPTKQLLVIKSEDLFNNREKAWEKIQKFLKIPLIGHPMELPLENAGEGEAKKVDQETRRYLKEKLEETYQGVKERYGIEWD